MTSGFIGLAILFAAYSISRFMMTGATKNLADSDKLRIHEVFSKRNNYATVFLLAIVLLYFAAIEFMPHLAIQTLVLYLIIFVFYLVFRFVSNYRKLKQMEMPAAYIKRFIAGYVVFVLGFLGMAFGVLWNWRG